MQVRSGCQGSAGVCLCRSGDALTLTPYVSYAPRDNEPIHVATMRRERWPLSVALCAGIDIKNGNSTQGMNMRGPDYFDR